MSGSSPIAASVEIHESTIVDGIAKMRRVEGGIEIKPGETVTLKSGGAHLMFVKPTRKLMEGERFPVNLHFKRGGDITVEFAVQGLGASKPAPAHDDHVPKAD